MQLHQLSAIELRALLGRRAVSCVEVMEAHLAQIARTNPRLNAIVNFDPDRARALAARHDADYRADASLPPLWGLPTAHKDLLPTRDFPTTFGSTLYAHHRPAFDALVVERIRAAGAIAVGKTNTPEFGAGSQTFNRVFGATRNPYDLRRTCGGSSGGAAVAVAARMLPLADGSDLGGSLRNPAAFCNVLGLRPSAGRVPAYPMPNPWADLPVLGPIARNVDDLALFLSVLAGADPRVPFALTDPGSDFYPVSALPLQGLSIALTLDFGGLPVQRDIRDCVAEIGTLLESNGARVETACPDLTDAGEIFHVFRAHGFRTRFGPMSPAERVELKDTIRWNLAVGEALTIDDLDRAQAARAALFARVAEFFTRYDFLLGPTTQVVPFDIEQPWVTAIDGVPMRDYLEWMQSCARITVTGSPALSLPGGFSRDGLPIGLQIVAPIRAEARLLAVAKSIEAITEHAQRAPADPS